MDRSTHRASGAPRAARDDSALSTGTRRWSALTACAASACFATAMFAACVQTSKDEPGASPSAGADEARDVDATTIDADEVADDSPGAVSLDSLSETSREILADDPDVARELVLTLDDWFGTLAEPKYRALPEWADVGYDPNASPFDGSRALEGFDDDELDALRAANREHWADVYEAVAVGDRRLPGPWPGRRDLNRAWRNVRQARADLGPDGFRRGVEQLFAEDYPTSADGARLYAQNCQECHGMYGAGDGPRSTEMTPQPRDYRHGVFKFSSVRAPARPRRDDLRRTLEHGLPGTLMESWSEQLGAGEREALIDRVRWIAMRGEVERWLVASWTTADDLPNEAIEEAYREVWDRWLTADEYFVAMPDPIPPATPESIARGEALFHDAATANCASCHGDRGRGDGPQAIEVAPDGTRRTLIVDEWGRPAWPTDLTTGVFRGGTRPIDVYRRIYCGIPGTPMPGLADALDEQALWDVVHYVRELAGLPAE